MWVPKAETKLYALFVATALFHFTSSNSCESHHPISKLILTLSSRLTNVLESQDNLLFSPFSLSIALAMIFIGTQGKTKEEMVQALSYKDAGDKCLDLEISEGFRTLILSLARTSDAYSVSLANSVFLHPGYTVSNIYMDRLQQFYDSEVKYTDFSNNAILTMNKINDWVSNKTNGQIEKILNEPLDPMTVMVLMNIIYFKGLWKEPFNESRTRPSFFYKADGSSKVVPFMFLQKNFYFLYDLATNTSYLELDYQGGNVTMLLVLPGNPNVRMDVRNTLCNIKPGMDMRNVQVAIPKMRLMYKREMSRDMMALGMRELFSDRADLTGIREQNDLHVSLMVHKAVLVVDEKGSEASAVSGVGIYGRVNSNKPETFWANHPFHFYIIDKLSETILFAGKVAEP